MQTGNLTIDEKATRNTKITPFVLSFELNSNHVSVIDLEIQQVFLETPYADTDIKYHLWQTSERVGIGISNIPFHGLCIKEHYSRLPRLLATFCSQMEQIPNC